MHIIPFRMCVQRFVTLSKTLLHVNLLLRLWKVSRAYLSYRNIPDTSNMCTLPLSLSLFPSLLLTSLFSVHWLSIWSRSCLEHNMAQHSLRDHQHPALSWRSGLCWLVTHASHYEEHILTCVCIYNVIFKV